MNETKHLPEVPPNEFHLRRWLADHMNERRGVPERGTVCVEHDRIVAVGSRQQQAQMNADALTKRAGTDSAKHRPWPR